MTQVTTVDVLVIGGGTAGPMAAIKVKQANPALRVLLLEKAHDKRSGAISMGITMPWCRGTPRLGNT